MMRTRRATEAHADRRTTAATPPGAPLRPPAGPRPTASDDTAIDRLCIDTIRTLAMDAVQKADSGHPGTPMALAPVAYTVWQRDAADIDAPGHAYSFGVVKAAQARGNLEVLAERGRRALRIHPRDVDAGLAELAGALDAVLQ